MRTRVTTCPSTTAALWCPRYTELLWRQARLLASHPEYHVVLSEKSGGSGSEGGDAAGSDAPGEEQLSMQLFHSPLGPDTSTQGDGQASQRDRVLLYLFTDKEEADAFWRRVPDDAVARLHRAVLPSPVVFSAIDRMLDAPGLGGPDGKLGGVVVNPAQDSAIFLATHAVRRGGSGWAVWGTWACAVRGSAVRSGCMGGCHVCRRLARVPDCTRA